METTSHSEYLFTMQQCKINIQNSTDKQFIVCVNTSYNYIYLISIQKKILENVTTYATLRFIFASNREFVLFYFPLNHNSDETINLNRNDFRSRSHCYR